MTNAYESSAFEANRLIQVSRDCESAIRTAADVAESPEVRQQYHERAEGWAQLCAALQTVVQDHGGIPPRGPGVAGTLHRAWIKIKSAIGDEAAIAAECDKREAEALRRFAQADAGGLPPEVGDIVHRFCAEALGIGGGGVPKGGP